MTAGPCRMTPGPTVLAGKPVVRGTRLPVAFVIGLMAEGWSEADILADDPGMTQDGLILGEMVVDRPRLRARF
jgi:uncharacterized protein (DUF433 family)